MRKKNFRQITGLQKPRILLLCNWLVEHEEGIYEKEFQSTRAEACSCILLRKIRYVVVTKVAPCEYSSEKFIPILKFSANCNIVWILPWRIFFITYIFTTYIFILLDFKRNNLQTKRLEVLIVFIPMQCKPLFKTKGFFSVELKDY